MQTGRCDRAYSKLVLSMLRLDRVFNDRTDAMASGGLGLVESTLAAIGAQVPQ